MNFDVEKIKKAIYDIDYARRSFVIPHLDEIKGIPNSITTSKEYYSDTILQNIFAFDSNGKCVGRMSIFLTEPKGVFDIIVREDARNKGVGSKLLDKAIDIDIRIDIFTNIQKNHFTQDGRSMVKKWLQKKLNNNSDITYKTSRNINDFKYNIGGL
jgi:GNAT superfamily N-acetyltransferase